MEGHCKNILVALASDHVGGFPVSYVGDISSTAMRNLITQGIYW
jgi:hypothetical protein